MAAETITAPPQAGSGNPARALLGCALLVPFLAIWLVRLVLPTVRTVAYSFQQLSPLDDPKWVGALNYSRLFADDTFGASLGFTLALALACLLGVAIVPPLLAAGLAPFSRWLGLSLRLLFTIPLALFAPAGAALAWRLALDPYAGIVGRLFGTDTSWLADATLAPRALQLITGLSAATLGCGLGLMVYGWALRGTNPEGPRPGEVARPAVVVWVLSLLTAFAVGAQAFAPSFVLTSGGPAGSTTNLALLQYRQAFQFFAFGQGAVSATLLLLGLGLLGLLAGVLIVMSGLRLRTVSPATPPLQLSAVGTQMAAIFLIVGLLAALGVLAAGVGLPALGALSTAQKSAAEALHPDGPLFPAEPTAAAYQRLAEQLSDSSPVANSFGPPLAPLLVTLPVAYLGALGIGGLRPLGRHSEWLLLVFSPWLFVGVGPLSIAFFQDRAEAGLLNTLLGLIPPLSYGVPMLFGLTLFFRGQEPRWRAGGNFVRTMLLPSLPLALLLGAAAWLLMAQDLLWPLLVAQERELWSGSVALTHLGGLFDLEAPMQAAAIVRLAQPLFLLFLIIFGVFQLFYLDRLALVAGPDSEG